MESFKVPIEVFYLKRLFGYSHKEKYIANTVFIKDCLMERMGVQG